MKNDNNLEETLENIVLDCSQSIIDTPKDISSCKIGIEDLRSKKGSPGRKVKCCRTVPSLSKKMPYRKKVKIK